jgi:hypothetical protein
LLIHISGNPLVHPCYHVCSVTINRLAVRISCFGLALFVSEVSLPAQVASDPAIADSQSTPRQPQNSQPEPSGASADTPSVAPLAPNAASPRKRMFVITPDAEDTSDILVKRIPLTVQEKYVLALHQAFDVSVHVGNALATLLQQAANGQPHYGQGWTALGKRFAASEADQITGSILSNGFLPSILHQDPRFFRRGRGSVMARTWYAINRTVVTRNDSGASGFNTSQTLGQLISCGISTSYYPAQDRSFARVSSNWGVNLGASSGYNVLSEFYPDVMRAVFHRPKRPALPVGN